MAAKISDADGINGSAGLAPHTLFAEVPASGPLYAESLKELAFQTNKTQLLAGEGERVPLATARAANFLKVGSPVHQSAF